MPKLIALDKLIKNAQKQNVDLGKGNPYNRLRYYTKLGWIPHMERKKADGGDVVGHFPAWTLNRLLFIDKLRKSGATNDGVAKKVAAQDRLRYISDYFGSKEIRNQLIALATLLITLLILASQLGVISSGKEKELKIIQSMQQLPLQILDSGSAFVPSGGKTVFIKTKEINQNSKVYVSFNDNYSPATRYWVPKKISFEGFYVELDSPTSQDAHFSWWATN